MPDVYIQWADSMSNDSYVPDTLRESHRINGLLWFVDKNNI